MNLAWIAGGSVGAIVLGIVLAGGLDHVLWTIEERARRRHAGRRRGSLDLRRLA